jgi:hypothetical protein
VPKSSIQHITEEKLEQYHLQQLAEPAAEAVEEHLLVCEHCRTQLEELEVFTKTFRAVAPILGREDALAERGGLREWLRRQFRNPIPALAFGAVAALALFVGPMAWRTGPAMGPVAVVQLEAIRANAFPEAPAGRPLQFGLELTGLAPSPSFRAEITNENGQSLFTQTVTPAGPAARLELAEGLRAGRYWLRLYGREDKEPVREFGFTVR